MTYHFSKIVNLSFEEAIEKVQNDLKTEGFGIITQIDVKETLKNKINADFRKYKILGACNPNFAHRALQSEDKIGTMLPCNVVVQENLQGKTEVSAINPLVSMQSVNNPNLNDLANEVSSILKKVVENL
ncbi:DUF302 domain-containing protein [bacterium]|nr:DUF302 domain-containing protein [bacterium]